MNEQLDDSAPVQWSHDDPESCRRSIEAAFDDPAFVAEVLQIQRDFEFTMADGLVGDDLLSHFDE